MSTKAINPDLTAERKNANFNPNDLSDWLYDGRENVRKRNHLADLVEVR
jgi:hypothetical protein